MPLNGYQDFIRQGKVWVAENTEQIIGFILTKEHNQYLHIDECSVALSFQQQGIESALLAEVYQYTLQHRFTNISLTTFQRVS